MYIGGADSGHVAALSMVEPLPCGDESDPANRRYQLNHLPPEHIFNKCDPSRKLKSANEVHQHIRQFLAGTSSESTYILIATCLRDTPYRIRKETLRGKSKKLRR